MKLSKSLKQVIRKATERAMSRVYDYNLACDHERMSGNSGEASAARLKARFPELYGESTMGFVSREIERAIEAYRAKKD